jgi:hypothetical protein
MSLRHGGETPIFQRVISLDRRRAEEPQIGFSDAGAHGA